MTIVWLVLVALALLPLLTALVALVYYEGFKEGREWVWRRERDYWKENQ